MGVGGLAAICAGLIERGLPHSMPCAIVENATLAQQRVVDGTLASIGEIAGDSKVSPPALLIVGEVVPLRAKLAWFGAGVSAPEVASPV